MQNREVKQHEPLRVPERWTGQDRALVIQLERLLDDIYAKLGSIQKIANGLGINIRDIGARTSDLETETGSLDGRADALETRAEGLEEAVENRLFGKRTYINVPGGTDEATVHFPNGTVCYLILSVPGVTRAWVGLVYCNTSGVITLEQINSANNITVVSNENNYITVSFSYSSDTTFQMVAIPYRNDRLPDIVDPNPPSLMMMIPPENEEE